MYADSASTAAIATSTGISAEYSSPDAWCYSIAIATEGEDTQVGFEFDLARGLAGLDAASVARIYVDAWRDTYPLILPNRLLANMSVEGQSARWRNAIAMAARDRPQVHLQAAAGQHLPAERR